MERKKIEGTNHYIGIDGFIYSEGGHRYSRFVDNVGYYQSTFAVDRKKKYVRIHRLLAEYFIENPRGCKCVNHKDGNKLNVDISNLEWATNAENTKHAYDNGLYKSTYKCIIICTNKTTKEVVEFRSIRDCAKQLNLNRKTITSILKKQKKNNYDYDFEYKV